jgi:SAM-dependent methyltransferase
MQLKKTIKLYMPRRAFPIAGFVYGSYMRILCWFIDLWDRRRLKKVGGMPVPPASLRYRVHGSLDAGTFFEVGKRCSEDIEASLKKIGKDFDEFQNVLDFGCGCGRTLVWFTNRSQSTHLHGTDIDADAISWCRNNLDLGEFGVNNSLPPLEYPSEAFDFIYAISVFTHLNEDHQYRWLDEFRRITSPKGIVLLTLNGRRIWKNLRGEDVLDIQKKGFKYITSNTKRGIFPEWYQEAYHKRNYVLDRYSEYFNVLDYIPSGMNNEQDVVVLQKP